jgi:methanogenic corrinoid protein MtbC1
MGYTLRPADASSVRTMLLAALIDGDLGVAYEIATGLLEEGVPFEVLVTDVIGPVQTEIGRRWAEGDLTIADEHASTAATESLVALLAGTLAPADGPTVVIACPENDTHSLPGRVIAAALAVRGFRAMFLGASLPASDLGEFLEHQQPMALALSVSMGSALYRATHSIATAHAHRVPVIVGGQAMGLDDRRARAIGADAFAANATEAAELLDHWIVLPPEQLAPSAREHPENVIIEQVGPRLVATALEALVATGVTASRLADELARVLRVVQGALTLEDPGLLAEHLDALRAADRAHGLDPAVVDTFVAGLADAMDDQLAGARALLTGMRPDKQGPVPGPARD